MDYLCAQTRPPVRAMTTATITLRANLIAVLESAGTDPLPTSEICRRAGFSKLEQHGVVSPQLRRLARAGIVIRSAASRGFEATWRLNLDRDPATILLDTRQLARSPRALRAPVRATQSQAWLSAYEAVCQYVAEHGCLPDRGYRTAAGRNLRRWIENQQTAFEQGRLHPERARLLGEIDCWVWTKAHDQAWDSAYEALKEYVSEHGRLPRRGDVSPGGRDLHKWVQNQQTAHKRDRLRIGRARRLEQLDCWRWAKSHVEWEESFEALQTYVAAHGQLPPPTYVTEEGIHLGRWVKSQRANYHRRRLSKDRIARLEQLDVWTWHSDISSSEANGARALRAATTEAAKIADMGDLARFNLPAHLQVTAEMRRDHPDLSLAAVAGLLGVSKDVCTGRLRRFWQNVGQFNGAEQ